jgi:D-glycero-alpha-D-manno-heptose 1-phosphate guanylyltransferase
MQHGDRYGNVVLVGTQVQQFEEKQYRAESLINGGIYVARTDLLNQWTAAEKFSLETDVIEPNLDRFNVQGFIAEGYFIDIGIPADFERAQTELGVFV